MRLQASQFEQALVEIGAAFVPGAEPLNWCSQADASLDHPSELPSPESWPTSRSMNFCRFLGTLEASRSAVAGRLVAGSGGAA
jgi:hypothetical protein